MIEQEVRRMIDNAEREAQKLQAIRDLRRCPHRFKEIPEIDLTKRYRTREGFEVFGLCLAAEGRVIRGEIDCANGFTDGGEWCLHGRRFFDGEHESDLIEIEWRHLDRCHMQQND